MSGEAGAVSNSSPLIWLAKINRLGVLKSLFGAIIVPEKVRAEVSSGESADSLLIREAFREGWLRVSGEADDASALVGVSGLHQGEAEAVLLARRLGSLLLVDEREATGTARVFGVRPLGTVGVLLLGLAEGRLTFDEFSECLDLLIASGFWLHVDVYKRALAEARLIAERVEGH
jgi:predicted nucleic acid-binding protein